jgi:hypothetical protein
MRVCSCMRVDILSRARVSYMKSMNLCEPSPIGQTASPGPKRGAERAQPGEGGACQQAERQQTDRRQQRADSREQTAERKDTAADVKAGADTGVGRAGVATHLHGIDTDTRM